MPIKHLISSNITLCSLSYDDDDDDDDDLLPQPSSVLLFLKYGYVIISKTGQEGSTADWCWATANQSYRGVVRLWHLIGWWEFRIPDLRDAHLTEHLGRNQHTHIWNKSHVKAFDRQHSYHNINRTLNTTRLTQEIGLGNYFRGIWIRHDVVGRGWPLEQCTALKPLQQRLTVI